MSYTLNPKLSRRRREEEGQDKFTPLDRMEVMMTMTMTMEIDDDDDD